MKGIKKRVIIFLCVASILIGSLAVPLKAKAVVGAAVASFTLAEILTYVVSGVLAVGATIGLNEVLNSDEEMYNLVNHYLSESSGIIINESTGTLVKDEQEITIQDWIDGINNKYGAQMADQEGDNFLDKLNDIDLRLQYAQDTMTLTDVYILNESEQEALGTDKVYITEEEFQELLYALYLKNHGILEEQTEDITPTPSPDNDDDDNNHKLDWKTLAVTTASIPVAVLAVGGKTLWENIGDFFNTLLNDESVISDYPSLKELYYSDAPYYNGVLEQGTDGTYLFNIKVTNRPSDKTYTQINYYANSFSYPVFCTTDGSTLDWKTANPSYLEYHGYSFKLALDYTRYYDDGTIISGDLSSSYSTNIGNSQSWGVNVPVFNAADYESIDAFITNGDDSACINKENPEFTFSYVLDNANSVGTTLKPLDGISDTQGLSSLSLYNYAQDILDNQDTLKSNPDEYNTLILPKIDTLASSAENISFIIVSDNDNESDSDTGNDTDSSPTYGNDVSDSEDFEILTNPENISLPMILPVTIPSVAQKVKGTSDWEYNYSPFFIAIISMLMIDVETVKTHAMESLDKLPPLNGTQAIFDSINIVVDSINDEIIYPVISIDTPDILYQFYPYSEIVLCDTSDYARFFSFVRGALSFSLAIGFVIWLLRQLKITLSIN